ncbi:unnamed protein product, partial [Mesorhabditis belari]|uniref:Protein kinase domain-containing protein n=2 Tax=Mesorhabditis belari TaxID=2138241 RepID=A0AAF3FIN3_9BILA
MIPEALSDFYFRLNEFEKKLDIQAGGFRKVSYNKLNNQDVAIKMMEDPKEILQEAIKHRHVKDSKFIVEILGVIFDENDSPKGLALELCYLGTLYHVIMGWEVYTLYNISHIVLWMEQLASVLLYLKEKELVHRDLKPLNILMFDKYREIRVCDFGISAWEETVVRLAGTVSFIAPNPSIHFADHRDAMYSVGMILWQLIFRKHPYLDSNAKNLAIDNDDVLERVGNGERLPLDETHSSIQEVISGCWAHEKDERLSPQELYDKMAEWREKIQTSMKNLKSPRLLKEPYSFVRPHGTFSCTHINLGADYQKVKDLGFCVPKFANLIHSPRDNRDWRHNKKLIVVYNKATKEAQVMAKEMKKAEREAKEKINNAKIKKPFGQPLWDVVELIDYFGVLLDEVLDF